MRKSFQSKRKRGITRAFWEMAKRTHHRTHAVFGRIGLPYVTRRAGPADDGVFNGRNLLHFIGMDIRIGLLLLFL